MSRQIDTERVDVFCGHLFSALYSLDLLPQKLSARPTEYEKYPRLLFGLIRRYGSVKAGFKEWESKILRVSYRKEKYYSKLISLYNWMLENSDFFEKNKETIPHISKSLYGRLYNYLYPRTYLINEYIESNHNNKEAIDSIEQNFDKSVKSAEEKLINENILTIDEITSVKKEVIIYIKSKSNYFKEVLS